MDNMKAVRMHAFGGPEVLVYEDVPRPEPGDSEILVRVYAAGVNPIDWKIREGLFREGSQLPLIPGNDLAGVVSTVGPPSPPAELNVRGAGVFAQANTSQLTEIGGLIDAGLVKVNLQKVFPLAEARQAQAASQSGHTQGKIVLQILAS
jgi:NADPH:quinone reductase-like Zn-dependent oxidoreductase